jgi:hypothetical protein
MRQKIFFLKEIQFGTIICPRSNIEIISDIFPYFARVNKQFEIPRLFQNRSESNSNDSKHFFLHYTISETQGLNRMDM